MSDIELVIKIPEEIRLALINNIQLSIDQQSICDSYIKQSIINGTPLPKGHGRLGDLDELENLCIEHNIANSAYDNSPMIEQGRYSDGDCIWKPLFDFAPTIIKADKVESEDKKNG